MATYTPSYEQNRQCLGEVLPLDTPFSVVLDASEKCNFKCPYCFRALPAEEKKRFYPWQNQLMKWEVFTRAVEQLGEFPQPIKKISLSNHGEPLCNKRLPEMIKHIKKKKVADRIEIHTNASLLDEQYALDLAASGIDRIIVSLQGLSSAKYKATVHANISYEKLLASLTTLYKNKINTIVYIKIPDSLITEEEQHVFFDTFSPIADKIFIEKTLSLWKGQNQEKEEHTNKFNQSIEYQQTCSLTFYTLVVAPDGTIYSCTQPEISFNIGTIYNTTLQKSWNSKIRLHFLKKQLLSGRSAIKDCADCYIAQNSIMNEKDSLNTYRDAVLNRLQEYNTL